MKLIAKCVTTLGLFALATSVTAWAADKPFDPSRDPVADLKAAEIRAQAEHKNILLDVGGNWCPWCILLDRTLHDDADLHQMIESQYIVVHVNFGKENENKDFLSHYPAAKGYPAWYVLSPTGKLLKSEDTSELEGDHKLAGGYNKQRLVEFLSGNAPKS